MKWKLVPGIIALAIASTVMVKAQETQPPAPPSPAQMTSRHVARLTTLLNLTSAQQTQIAAILNDEQSAAHTMFSSMRSARTALETAIENNDTAGISAQATQIGNLTAQQVEARAKADAALYALLTPDQQAKYKQLHAGGPGGYEGPGMRPGGPHGPQ